MEDGECKLNQDGIDQCIAHCARLYIIDKVELLVCRSGAGAFEGGPCRL